MEHRHIITIGGSAGSIGVLGDLLAQLPKDFNAAILIVTHMSRQQPSQLSSVLARRTHLSVCSASDGQPIKSGCVYIARPDYHLFVNSGTLQLVRGPLENRMRPAIDVLFRSAAVSYRDYVTGIILSGMLDDGTLGLQAIKRCGGTAIVQSPEEAMCDSMPESAIRNVNVDHVLPVAEMGALLQERVAPWARTSHLRAQGAAA